MSRSAFRDFFGLADFFTDFFGLGDFFGLAPFFGLAFFGDLQSTQIGKAMIYVL